MTRWFTMPLLVRMRGRLLVLLGCCSAACARSSPLEERCPATGVTQRACVVELSRDAGRLHVPALTAISPIDGETGSAHLVFEDSTVAEAYVTEVPASALAASGDVRLDSLTHMDTMVRGLATTLVTLKLVRAAGAPVYAGMADVTLDSARAVNFSVETGTAPSRDLALRSLVASFTPREGASGVGEASPGKR